MKGEKRILPHGQCYQVGDFCVMVDKNGSREKVMANDECVKKIANETNDKFSYPIGKLWRIVTPESVRLGNCFLNGRLKVGDLFLCVQHSDDCFQQYIYVKEYSDCLIAKPQWSFYSYDIGDAKNVELNADEFEVLLQGGRIGIKS